MAPSMIPAPSPDFERRIIEYVDPVRQFFLASALYHSMQLGVLRALDAGPGRDTKVLADELRLDASRLGALLRYLQNEVYVVDDDGWELTAKGHEVQEFFPWYQMLVGGYTRSFEQLGDVLRGRRAYASRNTTEVGAGSCALGVYDALPLAVYLLNSVEEPVSTLIDVGCGDATFLMEILKRAPGLRGVGMDPSPGNVERGLALSAEQGLAERLKITQAGAAELEKLGLPGRGRGVTFMTAFVLQEFLEQDGEQAVRDLLATAFDAYPEAHWIVIEMDYRPSAPVLGTHGLARVFYNPYFLIHNITQQRLETREWWQQLFTEVGLSFKEATTDPHVDSTGLQIGFLLSRL
jgi:2-ketoarginine methyltransferase